MEELKERMMKLWKDTFGDPEEYVRMVFDTYFVEENVERFEDENGRLVSSLLAVPYRFLDGGVESSRGRHEGYLKGAYLCGLATVPDMRGRGLMKKLMQKFEKRAAGSDLDFSFLIPADQRLRNYYSRMGYVSLPGRFEYDVTFDGKMNRRIDDGSEAVYQRGDVICSVEIVDGKFYVELNGIEELHVCELKLSKGEFEELIEREEGERIEENRLRTLRNCHRLMVEEESRRPALSIMHGWRDFIAAIRDVSIADGKVLVLQTVDFKPFALMFCYNSREADRIDIRFSAARTEDCAAMLLLYLKLCCFPNVERATLAVPADRCGRAFLQWNVPSLPDASLRNGVGETISLHVDLHPRQVEYGMMKWLKGSKAPEIPDDGRGEVAIRNSQRVETTEDSCRLSVLSLKGFAKDESDSVCKQKENNSLCFQERENDTMKDSENCKRNSNKSEEVENGSCEGENLLNHQRRVEDSPEFDFGESSTANQTATLGYPKCLNISLMLD